jgi:hypothetical protein
MTLPWKENWSRAYKVTVGTREITHEAYTQREDVFSIGKVTAFDERTVPSDAVTMGNIESEGFKLRGFTFKLNSIQAAKEQGSDGETTQLDLYNLNDEVIRIINKEGCVVIVEAGYQDKTELAYSGDVKRVESFRQGVDVIHRLHCGSGAFAMRNTLANLAYDENVDVADTFKDLCSRLPGTAVSDAGLAGLKGNTKTGGRYFTGTLIDNINKVAAEHNLNYAHYNGKIVIIPYRLTEEDYTSFARTNYNLTPDVIKKISETTDKQDFGANDTTTKLRKLQINTFFIPVDIGQFVTIPDTKYTTQYAGTYQVKKRRTILESFGNAWDVVLEVDEVSR